MDFVRAVRSPSGAQLGALRAAVFVACLVPLALLLEGGWANTLGANPIEKVTRATGDWTLRLLLVTLAVTPARRLLGLHWLLRLRRMLGLFAFFYGSLHFASYLWLDQYFDWPAIAEDILERPYLTVGFSALLLMTPLALTSNGWMIRRLGGRRWQRLHRSVYAIAVLGVVHYWWGVKADILAPLVHAAILAVLLGLRAWWRERERQGQLRNASLPGRAARRVIPIARS